MRILSREALLNEIINEAKKRKRGWKLIFGKDEKMQSLDYYIIHPEVGIYLLKEYQKNPFLFRGVGGKIARKVDEGIARAVNRSKGEFSIIQLDVKEISRCIEEGVPLKRILEEQKGIKLSVKGKASFSKKQFDHLKEAFPVERRKIDSSFEKLLSLDGFYNSYA